MRLNEQQKKIRSSGTRFSTAVLLFPMPVDATCHRVGVRERKYRAHKARFSRSPWVEIHIGFKREEGVTVCLKTTIVQVNAITRGGAKSNTNSKSSQEL